MKGHDKNFTTKIFPVLRAGRIPVTFKFVPAPLTLSNTLSSIQTTVDAEVKVLPVDEL